MQGNMNLFQRRDRLNQMRCNNVQKHVKIFQQSIRQTRVERQRSQIRQNLLMGISDPQSNNKQAFYASFSTGLSHLKNNGLKTTLRYLRNIDEHNISEELPAIDQVAQELLAYTGYNQQLGLFELIEVQDIQKLASLIQWKNIPLYEPQPRAFIRILTLLTKYTGETSQVPLCYVQVLEEMVGHLRSLNQCYEERQELLYFSHAQVKCIVQLIFNSLGNIGLAKQQFHAFFLKSDGFLRSSIEELSKITSMLKKHHLNQRCKDNNILNSIIRLFQAALTYQLDQSNQKRQEVQQVLLNYAFEMVNCLLQVLQLCPDKCYDVQQAVAITIFSFLCNYLHSKPEIIISHDFTILFKQLSNTHNTYAQLQERIFHYTQQVHPESIQLPTDGQNKQTISSLRKQLKVITSVYLKLLSVVEVIFQLNIPSQDQATYYDIFDRWLDQYVIPIVSSVFSDHKFTMTTIIEQILAILNNLCLEQSILEKIIDELPILNKVFYYARSEHSTLKQRKNSLLCITSIVQVALEGHSALKDTVKDLVECNRVVGLIAEYVGSYVDTQLNYALLRALKILLESQPCQRNEDNTLWMIFCQGGGRVKLQKMIGMGGSIRTEEIDRLAEAILNDYSMEDI